MTKVEDPQLTKRAYRKALRDSFIIHKLFLLPRICIYSSPPLCILNKLITYNAILTHN